eukprot:6597587-Pyramimonas_sp.AAC.1
MSYPSNPVQFLLGIPSEIYAVDASGSTMLIRASENGQLAMVEELVRAGAVVDACTHLGDTALMGAAYQVGPTLMRTSQVLLNCALQGHAKVVRFLVEEAGATLDIRNEEGDTAVDLASTSAVRKQTPSLRHLHVCDGAVPN